MVAAQSDAARWLQSRVRQRGGRSAVVAAQSDTVRWLERGIINVQILRHNTHLVCLDQAHWLIDADRH